MEQPVLYLYGVMAAATAPTFSHEGIAGEEVAGLRCGPVDALVSRIPPEMTAVTAEAVMAHEQVLSSAMAVGTVIPAAVGHTFETEQELFESLELVAQELSSTGGSFQYQSDSVGVVGSGG